MTKQNRILTAMKGGVSDRVPVVLYGMNPYQLADDFPTYYSFGLGLPRVFKDDKLYHTLMKTVSEKTDIFYPMVLPKFYANCISGYHDGTIKNNDLIYLDCQIDTPKGKLHSRKQIDPNVGTTWNIRPFVQDEDDMEKIMSAEFRPYSSKVVDDFLHKYLAAQERLGEEGVMHTMLPSPLCEAMDFCNFNFVYPFLYEKKSLFRQFLRKISNTHYENIEKILSKSLAPAILRLIGSEYAVPPFCSPEMFREYVIEFDTPIIDLCHKHGCFVQWHCHGNIGKVLKLIMEAGPDALEPIEPPPDGDVTLAKVKEITKGKVCLVGNIETRHLLGNSTPQKIDRLVREAIESAASGGGFILAPTSILPISKLNEHQARNLLQYIESGLKYGRY